MTAEIMTEITSQETAGGSQEQKITEIKGERNEHSSKRIKQRPDSQGE